MAECGKVHCNNATDWKEWLRSSKRQAKVEKQVATQKREEDPNKHEKQRGRMVNEFIYIYLYY